MRTVLGPCDIYFCMEEVYLVFISVKGKLLVRICWQCGTILCLVMVGFWLYIVVKLSIWIYEYSRIAIMHPVHNLFFSCLAVC